MSIKLTDTQLVMLSAAAQRDDRCIAAPPNAKGAAAQKIGAKLITAGLAKEVKAKPGGQVWRRDDATGQVYALKLTAAGLKAIAVEDSEVAVADVTISTAPKGEGPQDIAEHKTAGPSLAPQAAITGPRQGSKLAAVVDLLRREGGATIDQLAAAMGWLPHTTRGALTGLRKRGFEIDRRKANDERASAYVILDGQNPTQV